MKFFLQEITKRGKKNSPPKGHGLFSDAFTIGQGGKSLQKEGYGES